MSELFTLRPLFPGSSEIDQLYKVVSVCGTPTADSPFSSQSTNPSGMDRASVFAGGQWAEGHKLANMMGFKFPPCSPVALCKIIPTAPIEALVLIADCLKWDPNKRPTAQEALQNPWFADCWEDIRFQQSQEPSIHALAPAPPAIKPIEAQKLYETPKRSTKDNLSEELIPIPAVEFNHHPSTGTTTNPYFTPSSSTVSPPSQPMSHQSRNSYGDTRKQSYSYLQQQPQQQLQQPSITQQARASQSPTSSILQQQQQQQRMYSKQQTSSTSLIGMSGNTAAANEDYDRSYGRTTVAASNPNKSNSSNNGGFGKSAYSALPSIAGKPSGVVNNGGGVAAALSHHSISQTSFHQDKTCSNGYSSINSPTNRARVPVDHNHSGTQPARENLDSLISTINGLQDGTRRRSRGVSPKRKNLFGGPGEELGDLKVNGTSLEIGIGPRCCQLIFEFRRVLSCQCLWESRLSVVDHTARWRCGRRSVRSKRQRNQLQHHIERNWRRSDIRTIRILRSQAKSPDTTGTKR